MPGDQWFGVQVFYTMGKREVQNATGFDLIESILAVFEEVRTVMNLCMEIQLQEATLGE